MASGVRRVGIMVGLLLDTSSFLFHLLVCFYFGEWGSLSVDQSSVISQQSSVFSQQSSVFSQQSSVNSHQSSVDSFQPGVLNQRSLVRGFSFSSINCNRYDHCYPWERGDIQIRIWHIPAVPVLTQAWFQGRCTDNLIPSL